jgi:hypothetical protein
VDLEVPRSSRGGGTSHFNDLAGQSELIASQKPDWEAYGKQRRDFSGAALGFHRPRPLRERMRRALMRLNPDKHSAGRAFELIEWSQVRVLLGEPLPYFP